jgi:hypothetical protein
MISEISGNLFDHIYDEAGRLTTCVCHCVSQDMSMGAGIALKFKQRFGCVSQLRAASGVVGQAVVLPVNGYYVFYLITKSKYFEKPTYDTLRLTLIAMRDFMLLNGSRTLVMPRIGCGLDRLTWCHSSTGKASTSQSMSVRQLLEEIFIDTDIRITVVTASG